MSKRSIEAGVCRNCNIQTAVCYSESLFGSIKVQRRIAYGGSMEQVVCSAIDPDKRKSLIKEIQDQSKLFCYDPEKPLRRIK